MKKRTYQTVSVEKVRVEELLPLLLAGCIIALDVAKQRFVVALTTLAGEVVKLFRFEHPTQTGQFLDVITALRRGVEPGKVSAAMEPTGTYGDAIRKQIVDRGVPVWMVSPKRTHDSQALFDNVQSLHDPKSAVLVAKLSAMGLATEWQSPPSSRVRLRALVDLREHEQGNEERCFGRMEAALARYWPEFGRWMDVREQKSALRLLIEYPGPGAVTADAEGARALLRTASRNQLSPELVEGVVSDAAATLGVPMVAEEELLLLRTVATQALETRERITSLDAAMLALSGEDEVFARLQAWMGTYTAAVIVTRCDPRQYANARQFEKACGLNLREKSSGEHKGRLSITKRGPALVRQVLYLFALRMIKESKEVRAWYTGRGGYGEKSKQRAVVAVMRKLARALFHVAKGESFDATKLFDLRRLDLDALPAKAPVKRTARVKPRAIARGTKRGGAGDSAHAST